MSVEKDKERLTELIAAYAISTVIENKSLSAADLAEYLVSKGATFYQVYCTYCELKTKDE